MPSQAHRSFLKRHLGLLAAFMAPFLLLAAWSVSLIRGTRDTQHEVAHCTAWNEEIGRYRDTFEAQHAKAASLLSSPEVGIAAAALDAEVAAFLRARETLAQRTHGEPDAALSALDSAVREYADQRNHAREAASAWSESAPGTGRDSTLAAARVTLAHLEHRRSEVLAAFQDLERRHRTKLKGAISASLHNRTQLSLFAAVSLVLALGFGVAATVVLWLKDRGEAATRFAQTLVETLPEGLLVWAPGGILIQANLALARMIGDPPQALAPGISTERILPTDIRKRLEGCAPGGVVVFNLSHPAGRLLAVEASVGILRTAEDTLNIAVFRDISRSTGAERQMLERRRLAEVGKNMASFCRDLQRLFHPVALAMEMLKRPNGSERIEHHAWSQLERGVQATSDLLAQIVQFAHQDLQPEQHATFDMNACVQEVVESFHAQGTSLARLDLDLASIPAMVNGPRDRFGSVVELLLRRALDATDEGRAVKVRTWDEGSSNCLEILDPGDAIPASQIDRVFDPVYITSMGAPESGFALFNAASTIQGMGGAIHAERLDGGWTRFLIQIPQGW